MTDGTLGWPTYVPQPATVREVLPQMPGYYNVRRNEDNEPVWAQLDPRGIWHFVDRAGRNRSVNFFNAYDMIGPL